MEGITGRKTAKSKDEKRQELEYSFLSSCSLKVNMNVIITA